MAGDIGVPLGRRQIKIGNVSVYEIVVVRP